MKIVGVDNHARETVSDVLHSTGYYGERGRNKAQRICDILNEDLDDYPGTYYVVKDDDYRLSRGMADIVGED